MADRTIAHQFEEGQQQHLQVEAQGLDRKELQSFLKSAGLHATGTNAVLRQAYAQARRMRGCGLLPATAVTTTSTNTSSMVYAGGHGAAPVASLPASVMVAVAKRKPAATTVSTTQKKRPASAEEKRLKRYRTSCSQAVRQRIARARTQRLYLVEPPTLQEDNSNNRLFTVLGSTGNIYKVTIGHLVQCSCPDHAVKGNICKHILFVMLKVVGLSDRSPLLYQQALLTNELEDIVAQLEARMAHVGRRSTTNNNTTTGVMANARVQEAYHELTSPSSLSAAAAAAPKEEEDDTATITGAKRQSTEDEDCPICFDPLLAANSNAKELLVYCKAMCGANFHAACMATWKRQNTNSRQQQPATCPNCRTEWLEDDDHPTPSTTAAVARSPEGYTNLGRLQGQSSQRDTSSYSEWYGYHHQNYSSKRRRR